ncbi:MAG: hypothetical protein K6E59_04870 [Bacilli bacterium]|nr:hypothetical protein [Bacilli bacterium]
MQSEDIISLKRAAHRQNEAPPDLDIRSQGETVTKRIKLSIEKQYTDGRKYDHFFDEGYLEPDCSGLQTPELSSFLGIEYIDFKTGEIKNDKQEIMKPGVPYVMENSFMVTTVCHRMEDDGAPCNEDTLYLFVECFNSKNNQRQNVDLPYRKGASVLLTPHPYQVTVLEVDEENVTVEIKDDESTTTHFVQLYHRTSRNDEEWYATGNPNDPADTIGPIIYVTLMRK